MSRSLSRLQAILLGAVVLVGFGLAGFGVFAVGDRQWLWSKPFRVTVRFQHVRGIEVGTPVRVQGIGAGEVVEMDAPAKAGGEVRVRLRLDAKVRHLLRADASAQIVSEGMLGGRAIEIEPGSAGADPLADGGTIASRATFELSDVVTQLVGMLQALEKEKGRFGELADNTNALLRKGTDTFEAIQQVAEGVKRVPFLRNYVEDPNQLVVRPNSERNRQWFATTDLFESGRAVLTGQGQERLKRLVPWMLGLTRHDEAEVVILAYAEPGSTDSSVAKTVTQQQADTVGNFLKDQGAIHKQAGLLSRKLTMRGFGTATPPAQEKEALPASRVEVIVYVPQK